MRRIAQVLSVRDASVMAKSARKRYRITGLRRMAGLLGAACVWWLAWCCACGVRDSIISEQPGVVLAVHQDDFSGFTCIGSRELRMRKRGG